MLKSILKVNGVAPLSKKAQQHIKGSIGTPVASNCSNGVYCPRGCHCVSPTGTYCVFSSGIKQGQYCEAL